MKLKLVTYAHSGNGLAIELIGETEAETKLIRHIWRFGKLDVGHGEPGGGHLISWKPKDEPEENVFK